MTASDDLSGDEQAELGRLRRKVAALEAAGADGAAQDSGRPPGTSRARWRTVVATVLIVLACLLAPLAVVAIWVDNTATNTDRYVETVAPLIDSPDVQDALTNRITALIFTYIDVQELTSEAFDALADQGLAPNLADQLQALTGPIANGVESFTRTQVSNVISSDAISVAWEQANRVAHDALVQALTGQGDGTVTIVDGAVTVNLAELIDAAKQQLIAAGFGLAERIPEVNAEFVIFQSDDLTKAQSAFQLLDILGVWLPIIVFVLIGIGVYIAKSHRRAFIGAGLGLFAAMLVLGIGLAVFRRIYLDALPPGSSPEAAATLYDTLIRFMRDSLRRTAIAALIVAAAAFLSGPSKTAVTIRRLLSDGIGALRSRAAYAGLDTGRVGDWVYRYQGPLRIATVAVTAAILIVFWNEPTIQVIFTLTVLTLLVLAIIEFLARPPITASDDVPTEGEPSLVPSARDPGGIS